jgi:3-hydroxyisobutyrate dehydrogenase-like beta-hydroxyacid dehydrogenase
MIIAVLGLGIIGSVYARHLKADGHEVRAWNRTPRSECPGAMASVPDAVRGADLVMIVVSDPAAVACVLDAALPVLKPGAVVAQHSTIGRGDTLRAAERVRRAGGRFLDMPFTGSQPAAEARQTFFFVGDDDDTLALVEPVYHRISKGLGRVGGVGQATALKLALNVNNALIAQALGESCVLAEAAGIPRELFFEMLDRGVGRSGLSDLKQPRHLARDYRPQFSAANMAKDLGLAADLAGDAGVTLPLTHALRDVYAENTRRGWDGDDFSGTIRTLEPQPT